MVGKTPQEIAQLAREAVQVAQQSVMNQPVYQQPPPYQSAQVPAQQPQWMQQPDEYMTGRNMQEAGSYFLTAAQQAAQQQSAPAIEIAAQNAVGLAKMQYAKDFQKYGPEINSYLARVPKANWTLDAVETVVNLVRSRHVDDIARERAEEMIAQGQHPGLRATGAGSPPNSPASDPFAALSDPQKERLAKAGLRLPDIQRFCEANNLTVDKWLKLYGGSAMGDAR